MKRAYHCRWCGRFLPGEYREHGIAFCAGACLDWFVKRRDLKQRLLPLETPSQDSEAEPAREGAYTAL
jgi:hypothetical protein